MYIWRILYFSNYNADWNKENNSKRDSDLSLKLLLKEDDS